MYVNVCAEYVNVCTASAGVFAAITRPPKDKVL